MEKISKLIDILDASKTELIETFNRNLKAILLHGSFSYKDLNSSTSTFDKLEGENGLLDKKPDLITIVSSSKEAIEKLGKIKGWSGKNIKKVLSFSSNTPYYFNLETDKEYELKLSKISKTARLHYKVAIIGEKEFSKEIRDYNIYLPARLSKFFNVVYPDETPISITETAERARDFFINLTLKILPREFSGGQFAEKYLQTTYLAEIYRIFDLIEPKHLSILEGEVHDYKSKKATSMRYQLENMLSPKLEKRGNVKTAKKDNFYNSIFIQEDKSSIKVYYGFLLFNIVSLGMLYKNWKTNKIGGGSNLSYVSRKFRGIYKKISPFERYFLKKD